MLNTRDVNGILEALGKRARPLSDSARRASISILSGRPIEKVAQMIARPFPKPRLSK